MNNQEIANFDQVVLAALKITGNNQHAKLKQYLDSTAHKIYVIGKNDEALNFASRYKVAGVIDDYSHTDNSWSGMPIIKTHNLPKDSIIINCSTSISPVQVSKNLISDGFKNVVEVSDLISEDGEILPLPWFVSQQREEIKHHKLWWQNFATMLSDELSKKVLFDILRFRLTANHQYMHEYEIKVKDQYFEDFFACKNEVFVDAGGYDGDTTEEFITRYQDYKKVYLYEPSPKNLLAAKQRLRDRRDVVIRAVGLSDSSGTLYFNPNAGSASAVTCGVGESISVVTLDQELLNEPISFIKMDLEGWEINALRGAEQIIKKNKPKLAIAVYHAAKDFREIPQYLLQLHPGYHIYLRHYTQGWSETVMYFI
jgi:FkbM family methyltransferase